MRWTIGDVTVTKVVELVQPLPVSALLPDATPEALAPHVGWLRPCFVDEEGMTALSIHSLVVESRGRTILVDTCLGDREIEGMPGLRGVPDFPERLATAGFPVSSIDTVCCTHLHFDHVGWNTRLEDGRWVPTFTAGRYLFGRAEYEHWRTESPGPYTAGLPDTVGPVMEAGLADLVEPDHEITDEVRFVPTPGHTPAHLSVLIESGGERALITGDASHHPVQWAEPDWGMPADSDTPQAAATRRRLRAEHGRPTLRADSTLILGTHYAAPSAGRIVGSGDDWRFVAEEG